MLKHLISRFLGTFPTVYFPTNPNDISLLGAFSYIFSSSESQLQNSPWPMDHGKTGSFNEKIVQNFQKIIFVLKNSKIHTPMNIYSMI